MDYKSLVLTKLLIRLLYFTRDSRPHTLCFLSPSRPPSLPGSFLGQGQSWEGFDSLGVEGMGRESLKLEKDRPTPHYDKVALWQQDGEGTDCRDAGKMRNKSGFSQRSRDSGVGAGRCPRAMCPTTSLHVREDQRKQGLTPPLQCHAHSCHGEIP